MTMQMQKFPAVMQVSYNHNCDEEMSQAVENFRRFVENVQLVVLFALLENIATEKKDYYLGQMYY